MNIIRYVRSCVALLAGAALQCPLLCYGQAQDTQEAIRSAWTKITDDTRSLQITYKLARTQPAVQDSTGAPFVPDAQGAFRDVATLHTTVRFSVDGDKIALKREGESWSEDKGDKQQVTQHAVFNGSENLWVSEDEDPVTLGSVEAAKAPSTHLIANVETTPIWLAFMPLRALQNEQDLVTAKLKVNSGSHLVDGTPCIEVVVPFRSGTAFTYIYVDKSKGYRPVKYAVKSKEKVLREAVLRYGPHEHAGWALSGYDLTVFGKANTPMLLLTGSVLECQVNEAIDGSIFQLDFPVGAHIAKNGRYYIQQSKGKLKEISQRQYGARQVEPLTKKATEEERRLLTAPVIVTVCIIGFLSVRVYHERRPRRLHQ